MRLEKKPKSISIDAFYALAERDSELWQYIDRPAGHRHAALREQLLRQWRDFKRSISNAEITHGRPPTSDEVALLFMKDFNNAGALLNADGMDEVRMS